MAHNILVEKVKNAAYLLACVLAVAAITTTSAFLWKKESVVKAADVYSWQKSNVDYTESGDMKWKPEEFKFVKGSTVRYIDFENGSDSNDGLTTASAWKHHPWDSIAEGNAKVFSGGCTYVFKKGVTYRGVLRSSESGTQNEPIRLTVDPDWGTGEAVISGSSLVAGWTKASSDIAPSISNPAKVWYTDLDYFPRTLWQADNNKVRRMNIARTPNWTESDSNDVKKGWWSWDKVVKTTVNGKDYNEGTDAAHINKPKSYYEDAILWTEYSPVMSTPISTKVEWFNEKNKSIGFTGVWGSYSNEYPTVRNNRFYLEDKAEYLDVPGEFYVQKVGNKNRLFVRLFDDTDPNTTQVEAGKEKELISLTNANNIVISGLTFKYQNRNEDMTARGDMSVNEYVNVNTIKILGGAKNITISNNVFKDVQAAIRIPTGTIDNILICDNNIENADTEAISIICNANNQSSDVKILRNKLTRVGFRPYRSGHGHAVTVQYARTLEIAGNFLHRMYGSGLFIFGGKGSGSSNDVPFSRTLIHHNRVEDTLLNTNDWGGIETWQGGPFYVYDNISANPGGYWNNTFADSQVNPRFGFSFYLDGSYKNYVFNNVTWGKSNSNYSKLGNAAAFQEVLGFQNQYFNNTTYKFIDGSRRQAPTGGRNLYLGNLWMNISGRTFNHTQASDVEDAANSGDLGNYDRNYSYDTNAYGQNIFYKLSSIVGNFEASGKSYFTFNEFVNALRKKNAMVYATGTVSKADISTSVVNNASAHDFRLSKNSPAIGKGASVFVPWSLYGVVGEWNFRRNNADATKISDDHWYMTSYYGNREEYYQTPRFDLKGMNITKNDFVTQGAENFTASTLKLNGVNQYAVLANDKMTSADVKVRGSMRKVSGEDLRSPDIKTGNFLIESLVRIPEGKKGLIAGKVPETGRGYKLSVNNEGFLSMELCNNKSVDCGIASTVKIADGKWHHVIAEVTRTGSSDIKLYVDGADVSAAVSGTIPLSSLSNTADLSVGGGPGYEYLAGEIDFLRIAAGNLSDAQTTIEELYTWEFQGPNTYDFTGRSTAGSKRDAGAFQYTKINKPYIAPKVVLKSVNPKKLTTKTKTISGKSTPNAVVKLMYGTKQIKKVKASSKGNFKFSKLKLKKYKKKVLKLVASKSECRSNTLKYKKIKK